MSDHTKIEWADATVNAVNGCSVLSPGCTNCYAMRLAGTRLKHHPSRAGLTQDSKAGPVWTGEVRLSETALLQPLRWKRPRRIFWNAHGDLFHEAVPNAWIDRVFAVCALTGGSGLPGQSGQAGHHQHLILTKRSARMRAYMTTPGRHGAILLAAQALGATEAPTAWPLPNVWLGVSVEDQTRADERIPDLLATPAAVRWLSCEPLLGPVDLADVADNGESAMDALNPYTWGAEIEQWRTSGDFDWIEAFEDFYGCLPNKSGPMHATLDWIVAGGESGPGARPMHPDWARSLRDQCASAAVPFFFKQWGEWLPASQTDADGEICSCGSPNSPPARVGKKIAGRLLDGIEHNAFAQETANA